MSKVVLVTGASTGIGEATAIHLARKGHRVYAGVRTESDAERLGTHGTTPLILDVTDDGHVADAADRIRRDGAVLDGVVNNAGVALGGPIEFLPLQEWRAQFDVNVFGQLRVTTAMLPFLRRTRGRIVFMGSISGKVAVPLMGPYSASKHAIEAIGEALRHELWPWGIHVSVVEPGAIKTPIWQKGHATADRLERELPPEALRMYADQISGIREGIDMQDRQGIAPDKVAEAVEHALFARWPKTRYVVGTDARVQALLVRFLPDRAREAIIRRLAGP